MRRDVQLGPLSVLAFGQWGRPLLAFPSELGRRWDWEDTGMIDALRPLLDDGRVKVYCVDAADEHTWRADDQPLEERARRHSLYEDWIVSQVAPWIHGSPGEITVGCKGTLAVDKLRFRPGVVRVDDRSVSVPADSWGEAGTACYF